MPERHPASVEVKDGIPKVPRVSEDRSDGHVLSRAPRREPGPHKEPHSAPGSHKVPEGLALDVVPFALREHDLNREDVLEQPAVLIRAYPQPVLGQPAADGGSRSARGVDRRSHTLLAQTVSEDQPSDPMLDLDPILSRALRESYVAHHIETHYKDSRHPARGAVPAPRAISGMLWREASFISDSTSSALSGNTDPKGCSSCGSTSPGACRTKRVPKLSSMVLRASSVMSLI